MEVPQSPLTPPVTSTPAVITTDPVLIKLESFDTDAVPPPTVKPQSQQYQPLLPRTTPVNIRPLPSLSPYSLSPTGVPLSNFASRMYRPPVIPSREDQSKGRKGRRKRTTPYQLAELTKVFQTNESPGYDVREELTGKVGMTNREVQVWFQNRRAKEANRAKRAEQVEANRQEISGYRKMSATSSGSDASGTSSDGSSECVSLFTSSPSTSTMVESETGKSTSTLHRPIKMAPRKNSFMPVSPSLFSPFGRMSMAFAAPDGRIMYLQQPTFPPAPSVPAASPGAQQQKQQQQQQNSSFLQQPLQFIPSPTTFFPSPANFTTQPQVMLVPVLMSPGSYPLTAITPVAHRGAKPSGTDVVPRSVCYPASETNGGPQSEAAEKGGRRTEVANADAEKEKYAEAANVLASLATA